MGDNLSSSDLKLLYEALQALPPDAADRIAGQVAPRSANNDFRLNRRDAAIRTAADLICAGMKTKPAGVILAKAMARYHASSWNAHKDLADLPEGASPQYVALHRCLRLNRGKLLGHEQLSNIIKDQRGGRWCNSFQS